MPKLEEFGIAEAARDGRPVGDALLAVAAPFGLLAGLLDPVEHAVREVLLRLLGDGRRCLDHLGIAGDRDMGELDRHHVALGRLGVLAPIERGGEAHLRALLDAEIAEVLVDLLEIAGRAHEAAGEYAAVAAIDDVVPELVRRRPGELLEAGREGGNSR